MIRIVADYLFFSLPVQSFLCYNWMEQLFIADACLQYEGHGQAQRHCTEQLNCLNLDVAILSKYRAPSAPVSTPWRWRLAATEYLGGLLEIHFLETGCSANKRSSIWRQSGTRQREKRELLITLIRVPSETKLELEQLGEEKIQKTPDPFRLRCM